MEPFFLRCETCQARLRVRDERFLGQIQSCPKCGSMVHILAPAGWLVGNECAPETAPEIAEVATVATPSASASLVCWVREHAIACSVGAAAVVVACGLSAYLALSGEEQVASLPSARSAVESVDQEPVVAIPSDDVESINRRAPTSTPVEVDEVEEQVVDALLAPLAEQADKTVDAVAVGESSLLPWIAPPPIEATVARPAAIRTEPRTLTLEPVKSEPRRAAANISTAAADYPPAVETQRVAANPQSVAMAKPPVVDATSSESNAKLPSLDSPARRTNVKDQLAVPIESIDLPEMPLGEFVSLVSSMTAVPIELDAKVLGEVGLSSRSTVTVRDDDTTAGKLLARVLKEHQLTCIVRDGALVVVRAKRERPQ